MELQATDDIRHHTSHAFGKRLWRMTVGGGLAFFAATILFSLLPVAADFRRALSMSYVSVVIGASLAGLLIALLVSFVLLRRPQAAGASRTLVQTTLITGVLFLISIGLVAAACNQAHEGSHYVLVGSLLNAPRFAALALVVGYLYKRLEK